LGRIEEAMLNAANQIEFALVATTYPTNDAVLTPVPWSMLNHVWDQSKAGGTPGAVQTFLAPIDKAKLDMAPKISRTHRTDLPPDFLQRVYAFFGQTPGAIGATGSATASTSGGTSGGATVATTPAGVAVGAGEGEGFPPVVYTEPGGGVFFTPGGTNTLTNIFAGTNVFGSNVFAGTNVAGGSNIFAGGTNVFPGGTNVFAGGTNVFPGGTNGFVGATNTFEGGTNVFGGASNFATNPNLLPNTNATIQGSNGTQVGRTPLPGPQFTPSDLNRGQNTSGGTSGTTPPQSVAPTENAPATGTTPSTGTPGASTPRSAPMAPAARRR